MTFEKKYTELSKQFTPDVVLYMLANTGKLPTLPTMSRVIMWKMDMEREYIRRTDGSTLTKGEWIKQQVRRSYEASYNN
jgi:hypothetical protein